MPRPPRLHNLRFNEAERSPSRLLVIDSESHWSTDERVETHRLRLWSARLAHRHGHQARAPRVTDYDGWTADELADLVHGIARSRETLWVFAHNLSVDLTLTRLPVLLAQRGWELGRNNLASEQPWAHMKRGSRSLQLADSHGWLPVSVRELGERLGVPKLELPDEDDSDDAWRARCRRDVEITGMALEQLMDAWDDRHMGYWSITGAASAWNTMLHRAPGAARGDSPKSDQGRAAHALGTGVQRTVIDPDPVSREWERGGIYSGRRDQTRWGWLTPSDYVELDFQRTHLSIARSLSLPDRRSASFSSLPLDDWHIGARTRSIMADCLVRTSEPRYPVRIAGAVWHPVGTFWSRLCGPEIADARDRGALLEVGAGRSYRLGWQMQEWATWVDGLLDAGASECPPALRAFLKGASRSVPGRWAMQVSRELLSGPSHVDGWMVERAAFGSPPRPGAILHMAGRWQEVVRDVDADDCFPAVLAHIQSWARLLLGRLLDRLGPAAWLQCNTDSALLHTAALLSWAPGSEVGSRARVEPGWVLDRAAQELSWYTDPLRLRVKRQGFRCLLLSPQHVQLDGDRAFSGIPRSAVEAQPYKYAFWTWPRLRSQLEQGGDGAYRRELREVDLSCVPVPRWAYRCGCCLPVRTGVADGVTYLMQADHDECPEHGSELRSRQHPALERLM